MNNSVRYWPSSIPSTMQTLYHPFLSMTSCLFVDNWRKASHSCARLLTASDKVKRRMRCIHGGEMSWKHALLPLRRSMRSFLVRILLVTLGHVVTSSTEKTIHTEDVNNVDIIESMAELKVCRRTDVHHTRCIEWHCIEQAGSAIRCEA